MVVEEAGPAGPKFVRLLYFVGAGFICTAAINKWRDLQRKASIQQQHKHQLSEKPSNADLGRAAHMRTLNDFKTWNRQLKLQIGLVYVRSWQ
ncbi:hypothetical protein F0562_010563 [Nyssa sinensis]|uniref:Uncharacterized protein n=1 Tax=Nyssa sinensis TaxID=561372 RepID=A0A5J5A1S2_9ASTE|nr:hypothetical protein F0562_010563 [Nyssa sinensis]